MLNIVCVQSGNYCGMGADYVNRLYDMVIRNLPDGFKGRFVCFTDNPEGLNERIVVKSLPEGLNGWFNKLYLFSPDAFEAGERVLYFDLDTVITGWLDDIAAYKGDFAILRDYYRLGGLQSSVMAWEAGKADFIWNDWLASGKPEVNGGDQAWIETVTNFICFKPDILQDLFRGDFVSYKVHCLNGLPLDSKVVVFHGQPRPHEAQDEWVQKIWSIGGGCALGLKMGLNVSQKQVLDNIDNAVGLPYKWLDGDAVETGHAVIVGGAPSINEFAEEIKLRKLHGQKVFALNGSAKWLEEQGITPDYHVILDAREENAQFITGSAGHYLLASQCHPKVFDAVSGKQVTIWHSLSALGNFTDARPYALVGGSTVGLNAIIIAHVMGFQEIHIYGLDSSYSDSQHHAYSQPLNDNERVIEVEKRGEVFRCAPWMANQAEQFLPLACELTAKGVVLTIHGDGLLPFMAQHDLEPGECHPDMRAREILSRISHLQNPVGVEVGVFAGDLSKRLLGAKKDLKLYMVDPWIEFGSDSEYARTGDFHGNLSQLQQDECLALASGSVAFAGDRARIIRNYSIPAAATFPDGLLDFAFIDADHTYDAVKADLAAWYPKIKQGGLISGHDYNHPDFPEWGVKRAVDEFAATNGLTIETGDNYTWFAKVPN